MRLAALAGALTISVTAVAAAGAGPNTVTIAVAPGIVRWLEGTSLAGRVSNGKTGELVYLEAKKCPARSFRTEASVRTTAAGAWAAGASVETKTVFRARWRSARSREVVVVVRPQLVLSQISRRQFKAFLMLGITANGTRLLLQRFEAEDRAWKLVRSFVFRGGTSTPGSPQMTFSATAPKGALLRLTLPRGEAQPCYLAGFSNLLQT